MNDVQLRYSLGSKKYLVYATMLYASDLEALRRAEIERPFGAYFAEVPEKARRVRAVAVNRGNRSIARDDYRTFLGSLPRQVVIADEKDGPLPMVRVKQRVGRFDRVRVPVEIQRRVGVRDGVRGSYYVSTDSPQRQVGCVTARADFIWSGRIGDTAGVTLDERDGEGGGLGWCAGPYLGTVVYSAVETCPRRRPCGDPSPIPIDAELVARFSYRVR